MALTSEQYASFLKLVSCDTIKVDVVMDTLLKAYTSLSCVSMGYRTAVWDCMVAVHAYVKPELEHEEIVALISRHLQDNSDIGVVSPSESLGYQVQLFLNADEGCKQAMALGLVCFAVT
ncbi:MAG: hypothetical protein Q9N02_11940 [Ghiorsea sp.]|nr:hypothetical protein [Ghiorsea sp.]